MTAKAPKRTDEVATASDLFQERDRLAGKSNELVPEDLDARLLWRVVCILASRSASVSIGTTKDKSAWAVQYWDGKFPIKEYFHSTEDLNRSFAGLIRAADGQGISPEWASICEAYGW